MSSSIIKLGYIMCLTTFLSGCGVYIGSVKQTQILKVAVLKEKYEYTRNRNTPFCDETFTYRAFAGSYYPEFEDSNGVYYRGKTGFIQFEPLKVTCMKKLPETSSFEWAGIYIPNNQSLPAKMYVYSGAKPSGYQPVIPDDEILKDSVNKNTKAVSEDVDNPYTNGLVPALILSIERNSIQFLRFQAEDNSLRSAISITDRAIK